MFRKSTKHLSISFEALLNQFVYIIEESLILCLNEDLKNTNNAQKLPTCSENMYRTTKLAKTLVRHNFILSHHFYFIYTTGKHYNQCMTTLSCKYASKISFGYIEGY